MATVSSFTNFTINPQLSGFARGTEFLIEKQLLDYTTSVPTPIDHAQYFWDLGDGTRKQNVSRFTHIYDYPGTYTVYLSAFSLEGSLDVVSKRIDVRWPYSDAVQFTSIPSTFVGPGQRTPEPFVVSVTSTQLDVPLELSLFAAGSRSVPSYAVPEKWRFLAPRWRFQDEDGNDIQSVRIDKAEPITVNGRVAAVSGTAEFYYVDDIGSIIGNEEPRNTCPLLLIATLSTDQFLKPSEQFEYPLQPGHSNTSHARAATVWQIDQRATERLLVTENVVNELYPIKWTGIKIPITVTAASLSSDSVIFTYPSSNYLGGLSSIDVSLSSSEPCDFVVENTPLYFRHTDSFGNFEGGYVMTTITPLSATSSCVVLASAVIHNADPDTIGNGFGFPTEASVISFAYVSNPLQGTLNKISLLGYSPNCATIRYFLETGAIVDGSIKSVPVPVSTPTSSTVVNYETYGYGGIYGIAVNPITQQVYTADSELDQLYLFDTTFAQISTVDLPTAINYHTPSCLSLDEDFNCWVASYDGSILTKWDSGLNYLLSATNPNIPALSGTYLSADPLIVPTFIETDKDSNVWTTFAHPLCSFITKISSEGSIITTIPLPIQSGPVSVSVTANNDIWVANSFFVAQSAGSLELYSSAGSLLSSVSCYRPMYTALDRSGNLWVAHGINHISVLDTLTLDLSTWALDQEIRSFTPVLSIDPATLVGENTIWGGLATDAYDRVWVIDNEQNRVYSFFAAASAVSESRSIKIIPPSTTMYVILPELDDITTEIETTEEIPSAQAAGDWTGNRWIQKYASASNVYPVSGQSLPFVVKDLDDGANIEVLNSRFSMAGYFDSLALPEILKSNRALFDQLLVAVAGDATTEFDDLEDVGEILYQRIANFTEQHVNIDKCHVPALLSFAEELALRVKIFAFDYPREIQNLVDYLSINLNKLRGHRAESLELSSSLGTLLDSNSVVLSGQTVVLMNKATKQVQLFENPSSVILSALSSVDLLAPVTSYYDVYTYAPSYVELSSASFIDWESPRTTINWNISATEEWTKYGGLVEEMFSRVITKNLFT